MTREEKLYWLNKEIQGWENECQSKHPIKEALYAAREALEQEPRKGKWLRLSDLSEREDDRYKCSRCGNVIHNDSKIDLYIFHRWCGRCGSDNGIEREIKL